jgi:transposase-like protein
MPGPTYDPAVLVARMAPESLRSVARRLGVDPAMLCRPWSERQADRYATALDLHPGEVWGDQWWHGVTLDDLEPLRRSEPWQRRSAARLATIDGTGRQLRRAALLTVAEAAQRLGVKPERLRHWEAGRHPPAGDVAEVYGAFLAELVEWLAANTGRVGLNGG